MDTINISLPSQLKNEADDLINRGYFASFSDLVRTALRQVVKNSEYDLLSQEAIMEHRNGNSTVLSTSEEVDKYVQTVTKS
jgi:Arc/MetJ-type ribon-helix-helix transcriptional regulator